jgi:hypothetical protein
MTDPRMASPAEIRRALKRNGYSPIPVNGKAPVIDAWQKKLQTNDREIELWSMEWPRATNTGTLTQRTPAIDIDIMIADDRRGFGACDIQRAGQYSRSLRQAAQARDFAAH